LCVYIPATALLGSQWEQDKKTIWHISWVFKCIRKIAKSDY